LAVSARYAALVADLLAHADIRIDGPRPWDVTVRDPRFYKRALAGGAIGLGESFMDGWWDTPALDQAIARMLGADLRTRLKLSPFMLIDAIAEHLPNLPYVWPGLRPFLSRFKTYQATAETHYEVGNDFYRMLLGPHMIYSCTYWDGATTLDQSEDLKLEMSCRKLALAPGQRLLEIGCGWGSLAITAAKRGAEVVGLTLSREQKAWADQKIAAAGLADRIEIRLQDYRETSGRFDAIASVEMVEAVGQRWWGAYLDTIARNLPAGGRAALQFISMDHRLFDRYARSPDFIQTYIFPGGILLNEPRFEALARERGLSWDKREGFAADYAETLRRWRGRYDLAVARGALNGFGEAFHNLWRYYLMYCEGGFRGRSIDVAQVTMVKR